MLGAGRGSPIGDPVIAALRSVDPRRRWPQQGEVPNPQLITVTSEPGPSPEGAAARRLLRGAGRDDSPSDAAVTAPVRGYRQIYSGALIEPLIEDHLPRLVLVGHCDIQILGVALLGSDAWRYAC
jgi:hypothetical protein